MRCTLFFILYKVPQRAVPLSYLHVLGCINCLGYVILGHGDGFMQGMAL